MKSPEELERLTRRFPSVLGLRLLPFGIWFLILGLGMRFTTGLSAGWPPPLTADSWLAYAVLLPVVVWFTWVIHRRYRLRYGAVEPGRLRFGRGWVLGGGALAAYLLNRTYGLEDPELLLVTTVPVLFVTAVLMVLPISLRGGMARLRLPFLLVALAAGGWLFWLVADGGRIGSVGVVFSLLLGALLTAAGAVEHRALVRAFGPFRMEEENGTAL